MSGGRLAMGKEKKENSHSLSGYLDGKPCPLFVFTLSL